MMSKDNGIITTAAITASPNSIFLTLLMLLANHAMR
jgi:hypothetical protein